MATETATNVVVAFWSFHFNNLILHLALPNFRWFDQNYTMQNNCFCLVVSPPWSKWEKWSREPVTPDQNVQHSVSNAETKFTRFCETRIRISSGILVLICVSKLFDAIVKKNKSVDKEDWCQVVVIAWLRPREKVDWAVATELLEEFHY